MTYFSVTCRFQKGSESLCEIVAAISTAEEEEKKKEEEEENSAPEEVTATEPKAPMQTEVAPHKSIFSSSSSSSSAQWTSTPLPLWKRNDVDEHREVDMMYTRK